MKIKLLTIFSIIFALAILPAKSFAKEINSDEFLSLVEEADGKKMIIINFYASWCPPCRDEIPHIIKTRKNYSEDDVLIIGVNLDDTASAMNKFDSEYGINYPTIHDSYGLQGIYEVRSIPFNVIYSSEGEELYAKSGYIDSNFLKKTIDGSLGGGKTSSSNRSNNSNSSGNSFSSQTQDF